MVERRYPLGSRPLARAPAASSLKLALGADAPHGARPRFWLMGIRLDVTGTWPKATGVVIVSNHASYLDGLVLAAVIPGEPAFIAKKELEPQFFAGPFLRQLGALFVDRADPEGGVEDVNKALDVAGAGTDARFPS